MALACLLFLIGGYHLLYRVRLAEVKSAVKKDLSRLKREDLTQLVLSPAETANIQWEDASEFHYKNRMYDVVEVEKKDGQTIYWCLSDEKETALVEAYLKSQNQSSDKNSSHSLSKLLKSPFLPAAFRWNQKPAQTNIQPLSVYSDRLLSADASVLTPPPKVC